MEKLIFVEELERYVQPSGQTKRKARYKCFCGKLFDCLVDNVNKKNTKSCGCLSKTLKTKHGLSCSKTYNSWDSMIQRCTNQKVSEYKNYGGRGIKVCEKWLESFENFYKDMGERPDNFTLERINVNGDYEPENCKWASLSEQGFNKRMQENNTSGKSGVSWCKERLKWVAYISVKGKVIQLGRFKTYEEAVDVRKTAELEYYGFNKN